MGLESESDLGMLASSAASYSSSVGSVSKGGSNAGCAIVALVVDSFAPRPQISARGSEGGLPREADFSGQP